MRFLPGNAQHIGARHSQQDSFGFTDPGDQELLAHGGFVAVVCDGMGGMEFGDEASRVAVRGFLDAYARKTAAETIPAALERSVRDANARVVELAGRLGLKDGVGTTLVAAALHATSNGGRLYYISVGDSGLFLSSAGELRTINRPHVFATVLDAAVARGTMSREDAQTHPERESLTSYIGTDALEQIDRNLEPFPILDGDTVLLASDGLFKTLSSDEIQACLTGDPQGWAEALVDRTLARKREYQDNVTVLSVTASKAEGLPRTELAPTRTIAPTHAEPASFKASLVQPPPSEPPVSQPAPSQPAIEWPSGEHPAVPEVAAKSSSWWMWLALIVVIAAGAAGWWYEKAKGAHRGPSASDPAKIELPALKSEPPAPVPAVPQSLPQPTPGRAQ